MSRDNIVNKSDPPKSEWFGYKYRVTPETSKLLQEAVFKDGGSWGCGAKQFQTGCTHIWVSSLGEMSKLSDGDDKWFVNHDKIPIKQPPQPLVENIPYQFKVGDKVRIKTTSKWFHSTAEPDSTNPCNTTGKVILQDSRQFEEMTIGVKWDNGKQNCYRNKDLELVVDKEDEVVENIPEVFHTAYVTFPNSYKYKEYAYKINDSDYELVKYAEDVRLNVDVDGTIKQVNLVRLACRYVDPKATKEIDSVSEYAYAKIIEESLNQTELTINKQEETKIMSNVSKVSRRVLNIQLLDNDAGLPVEHALVAEFEGVVTEDSNEVTLQELISSGEVAEKIKVHNKLRADQIDLGILERTGNTVKLRPIKLKDLSWNIK